MNDAQFDILINKLDTMMTRMSEAVESLSDSKTARAPDDWRASNLWIWQAHNGALKPITASKSMPLALLVGLDQQTDILFENTANFARGFPANNALLWGARGMGKSSLVKAVHGDLTPEHNTLHLIEIYREDLSTLPLLLSLLREQPDQRFILFCDDLSFDEQDSSYKTLKALLDGGLEGRPANVIIYATSNRRHLIPRNMIENERKTAIHASESVEEKVSLSDRFGLWLGFYQCNQDQYLAMVKGYGAHYGLKIDTQKALEWATTRGHRSGRTAWQFIQHIAGAQGKAL